MKQVSIFDRLQYAKEVHAAIEAFDQAAQFHGLKREWGTAEVAKQAKNEYVLARKQLRKLTLGEFIDHDQKVLLKDLELITNVIEFSEAVMVAMGIINAWAYPEKFRDYQRTPAYALPMALKFGWTFKGLFWCVDENAIEQEVIHIVESVFIVSNIRAAFLPTGLNCRPWEEHDGRCFTSVELPFSGYGMAGLEMRDRLSFYKVPFNFDL